MSKKHYIIPIFVPHKGCPHDCIFCNQKKITGQLEEMTVKKAKDTIESYMQGIDYMHSHVEIAFFGGSFTAIPIEKQNELLEVAYSYKKEHKVKDIRLSTRPDAISVPILENLKKYGVTIVELGVQSMDEEVLEASNRGHDVETVKKAVALLKQYNFLVGVQVMLGLPKDTFEKSLHTVKSLIALKPDMARIYPALTIKDTYMETLYHEGAYRPLSLEECVQWTTRLLLLFLYHHIPVIRIGLQPTESIAEGKELVAGPFHPAFRQLVESEIALLMMNYLLGKNAVEGKDIEFTINPLELSFFIGQKRKNMIYIKNQYLLKSCNIVQEKSVEKGTLGFRCGEVMERLSKVDFICFLEKEGLLEKIENTPIYQK